MVVRLGDFKAMEWIGESRSELDSHAEVTCVGKNVLIISDYDRPVDVTGYDPDGPKKEARTVSAALAYIDPATGKLRILVLHQAIYIPTLEHNLLSTMQMRMNDIIVNDVPKHLTPIENLSDRTHALVVPRDDGGDDDIIPLALHRVNSYFPTRKPTRREYEECDDRLELTFETPDYDPTDPAIAEQEEAFVDSSGHLRETGDGNGRAFALNAAVVSQRQTSEEEMLTVRQVAEVVTSSGLREVSPTLDDLSFIKELKANIKVSSLTLKGTRKNVDAEALSEKWGIGIEAAERTVRSTTQRGMRSTVNPTLLRRFRTNDRQLRYRRLPCTMFTDYMKSNVKSHRGNIGAQVFATREGWARAFGLKKESDNHHALSLLFQRDGAPNAMVMDGAKSQVRGQFRKKLRDASVHVRQIEPHSPWSNVTAEGTIRELKKSTGRKMVKSKCPKCLWDDCLEYGSLHQVFHIS